MPAHNRSPINAVVFDLGNVLVGWNPYLPLANRMSEAEWQEFARASDFAALNAMADRGVSLRRVIRLAAARNPLHGELIALYYERFIHSLTGPIIGSAEIVAELREAGLRLLGLTNWSAETYHLAPESTPAISMLEAVMVSGREGVAKPDPEIFLRMVETHHLVVEKTVFVDDSEHNVEAAAALGFIAIRFSGAAQLRKDLQQLDALR
ncbi:HAD family phosphatase [Actinomycetaceae bacterium L2_0104]